MEHIAVFRMSAMGDVVISVPVVTAFSEQYPDVKITYLTRPLFAPMFSHLPNVEVFTNVATEEIVGDGSKVTGIRIKDRNTDQTRTIDLDGVFVQIGLAANSAVFASMVETNRVGEIVVDERCRTSKARMLLNQRP